MILRICEGKTEAGYGMSTEEGISEFLHVDNAALLADLPEISAIKPSTPQPKQKARKKMAKDSRRANRKPKKKKTK